MYFKTFPALFFVFSLSIYTVFAQTLSKEIIEADNLFLNNRFSVALPSYLYLLKTDPSATDLNFKIGVCYLNSRSQKPKAAGYFEKAVSAASPVMAYKFLGDAYQLSNKFDQAIASYEKFKKILAANKSKDLSIIQEVGWKIEMCKVGKKLQELNTPQAYHIEYTSALSFDQSTMTFTFQSSDGINKKSSVHQNEPIPLFSGEDIKYFEDIYIPGNTGLTLSAKIATDTTTNRNEAEVATSVDGQIVLTYMNDTGEANLYISRLVGNQWTSSEKLSRPVNLKGWEPNEFISADGHTLYFTSNRAGGFGGKDIYTCKKLSSGEWGKAMNLGSVINTPFDEEAPFIYSDGLTLFFSSNKYKQRCCFDIFKSRLSNNGVWSEPGKVGYPVKTVTDDVYYVTTVYQGHSPEAIKAGNYNRKDLFRATFIDQGKTPYTILKGKVIDMNGKVPRVVKLTVTDNETGEVLGIYGTHPKTGSYLIPLPAGRNNNITYESNGYLFQSENMDMSQNGNYFEIHELVLMSPLSSGSKVVLGNIFFDFDRAYLRSVSNVELDRIFLLLSANPEMIIELSYYIDTKENSEYNMRLAQERAQMVTNYMVQRGIKNERIIAKSAEVISPSRSKRSIDKKNSEVDPPLGERLELKIIKR